MTDLKSSAEKSAGAPKEIFPKVLSASRATDLPAFFADWFMERLREGFCEWQNPFNANQRQTVNFRDAKAIVFWSKNPAPLIPYLDEIAASGKNFYFQFTLNNYESEGLEREVPELEKRLDAFSYLATRYPVIWRYDPVVVGGSLTIRRHLRILEDLIKRVGNLTPKLVFSFVDIYGRVGSSLRRFNGDFRAPSLDEAREFSARLAELRDKLAPNLKLATCAEADIDFKSMGIEKNSCIDPELINKICGEEIYPIKLSLTGNYYEKDKGQRDACGCAPSKDIGSYRRHPCRHHCAYCYAGHSRGKIKKG